MVSVEHPSQGIVGGIIWPQAPIYSGKDEDAVLALFDTVRESLVVIRDGRDAF